MAVHSPSAAGTDQEAAQGVARVLGPIGAWPGRRRGPVCLRLTPDRLAHDCGHGALRLDHLGGRRRGHPGDVAGGGVIHVVEAFDLAVAPVNALPLVLRVHDDGSDRAERPGPAETVRVSLPVGRGGAGEPLLAQASGDGPEADALHPPGEDLLHHLGGLRIHGQIGQLDALAGLLRVGVRHAGTHEPIPIGRSSTEVAPLGRHGLH